MKDEEAKSYQTSTTIADTWCAPCCPPQPCYRWWEVPYYWAGLKAYDLVAGTQGLTLSRYVTPAESLRQFPTLAARGPAGATLKGTVRTFPLHHMQV